MSIISRLFRDNTCDELHDKLQQTYDQLVSSARQCKMSVDFRAINAVSIERMYDKANGGHTCIGYKVGNNESFVINEWYLHCSEETHQQLYEEFIQYRDSQ